MAWMRNALLAVLLLVIIGGIYLLLNEPAAGSGTDLSEMSSSELHLPDGVVQLLKGQEFSAIASMETSTGLSIFAGGISGLYQIDPNTLETKELQIDGMDFKSVRALLIAGDDLWVGHDRGLAVFRDGQLVRQIGQKDGLLDERILDLLRIDEKNFYVATYSGVAVLDRDGQFTDWRSGEGDLPGESIKVLFKDDQGGVWMGAYNARGGGILVENGQNRQFFSIADGLVHNSITSIAQLVDGRIAVGGGVYTEGGASLLRWVNNHWQIERNLYRADGLAGEKVRQLFVDREDRVWICSEYDGVAIFSADLRQRIKLLTTDDGLSDNEVKKIVELDNGDFWLATRDGLTRIRADIIP